MTLQFFERPILNSPYVYPAQHWELDLDGQPTGEIAEKRRPSSYVTPVPKPSKRRGSTGRQGILLFDDISTAEQVYDTNAILNKIRKEVDTWRQLSEPAQWLVTPETARLLQYWRHHSFQSIRPFFCQVEAHPLVRAYVKNQGLGLEVPYLMGSTRRKYLPDFIVQINDGHDDPLNVVVEIKGFRGEDAKEKANTMQVYWVPGVNNLGRFGRWAFAEFTAVFEIQAEFDKLVTSILSQ